MEEWQKTRLTSASRSDPEKAFNGVAEALKTGKGDARTITSASGSGMDSADLEDIEAPDPAVALLNASGIRV